ncbi:MAG: hypothetical protein MUF64_28375 [Polyangiaceae bacterium]|jgi:hypothetical protein|nr:hypothetical protein [Polyangiaceae bacterium]
MKIGTLVFKVALLGGGVLSWGCDDPVPPSAQAAVKYRLDNQPQGPSCTATTPDETFGAINTSDLTSSTPLVDGDGGVRVVCKITPSGAGFTVSASVKQGPNNFGLRGQVTPGQASPVSVSIAADSIKAGYTSNPENPCQLRVDGDSPAGLGISPGKMRAILSCPDMILGGATTDAPRCAIAGVVASEPGGYVFFDNCDE